MRALLISLAALLGLLPSSTPLRPTRLVSVDTLIIVRTADTLPLRGSDTVSARIADSLGRAVRNVVTWTSRDTAVFKIRSVRQAAGKSTATIRAYADTGRAYLVASAGSLKDSLIYVVRDTTCSETTLGSLDLGRDSITMHRTDTASAVVLPRNTCGGLMNGQNVVWSSSDTAGGASVTRIDSLKATIISVDSTGTTYIKAVVGTKRDSIKVKHKPAP